MSTIEKRVKLSAEHLNILPPDRGVRHSAYVKKVTGFDWTCPHGLTLETIPNETDWSSDGQDAVVTAVVGEGIYCRMRYFGHDNYSPVYVRVTAYGKVTEMAREDVADYFEAISRRGDRA